MPDPPYYAGILDADGSISITKANLIPSPSYVLVVTVTNNYEPLIDSLVNDYGGNKRQRRAKRVSYCWYINGKAAVAFLKDALPYLMVKRERAILGIKFQQRKTEQNLWVSRRDEKGRILKLEDSIILDREKARQQMMQLNAPAPVLF